MRASSIALVVLFVAYSLAVFWSGYSFSKKSNDAKPQKQETIAIKDTTLTLNQGPIMVSPDSTKAVYVLKKETGTTNQHKGHARMTDNKTPAIHDTVFVTLYQRGSISLQKSWPIEYHKEDVSFCTNIDLVGQVDAYTSSNDSLWLDPKIDISMTGTSVSYMPKTVVREKNTAFRLYGNLGGYWSVNNSFVPEVGAEVEINEIYTAAIGYSRNGGDDNYNARVGARIIQW